MSKILNAIGNKINDIRDDIYATYFGICLGIHLTIMRYVGEAINDLFRLKRYYIKRYGTYTLRDHLDIIDMLEEFANRNPIFGFEAHLIAQGFDLEEAEELKKEFGLH